MDDVCWPSPSSNNLSLQRAGHCRRDHAADISAQRGNFADGR